MPYLLLEYKTYSWTSLLKDSLVSYLVNASKVTHTDVDLRRDSEIQYHLIAQLIQAKAHQKSGHKFTPLCHSGRMLKYMI